MQLNSSIYAIPHFSGKLGEGLIVLVGSGIENGSIDMVYHIVQWTLPLKDIRVDITK